ncbi:acyl-CoA transferase [Epibacterium sp. SM1979]|uniref:Acyl-CoA transferase n=1 Tax=Tritonibacter litoralis TaxID=2662264 RepID=A0A843YMM0_9RHOB|nr:CoA transferase [Tritonibacter litoralis]MQQ10664.1 acyl-CoA transferase [Tritonibacter litoralis]
MFNTIEADLRRFDSTGQTRPAPRIIGIGGYTSDIPVSTLAIASASAAVSALQSLCASELGHIPDATVDAAAIDHWCKGSVQPANWSMQPQWDRFSRDYRTENGWIRLHTNAEHHRDAALSVLGRPTTPDEVEREITRWDSESLEAAIVEAGGCAAQLRLTRAWHTHPQGRALSLEPIVAWDEAPSHPCRWNLTSSQRPMSGLRVLDATRVLAGPVATRFLASLGADVLRIDPPDWNEDGNAIEMTVGKTCAGLDLRDKQDRATFRRLIQTADVLVHGYRADALEKLGFGVDACRALNPGLITVCLNAYGWTGPWTNRRGFDSLVQRSTGLAEVRDNGVVALPYQVLDHATGYLMAATALHALRYQREHGKTLSARLSLARQAKLLLDHRGDRATQCAPFEATQHRRYQEDLEQTDWGPVRRLRPAYMIAGIDSGWDRPAHHLRSDVPAWRPKVEE